MKIVTSLLLFLQTLQPKKRVQHTNNESKSLIKYQRLAENKIWQFVVQRIVLSAPMMYLNVFMGTRERFVNVLH